MSGPRMMRTEATMVLIDDIIRTFGFGKCGGQEVPDALPPRPFHAFHARDARTSSGHRRKGSQGSGTRSSMLSSGRIHLRLRRRPLFVRPLSRYCLVLDTGRPTPLLHASVA